MQHGYLCHLTCRLQLKPKILFQNLQQLHLPPMQPPPVCPLLAHSAAQLLFTRLHEGAEKISENLGQA